jgi:DNA-binding NarL/FixJ family response regulator
MAAPYLEAYAVCRQGEATLLAGDRRDAARTLAAAHADARGLGAAPLVREIEELAALHRVSLADPERPAPVTAADPAAALGLTAREMEVLALIAQGRTNRAIAEALVISQRTADVHVSRIFAKLGVHNRVSAVAAAHRAGVLAAPRAG